MYAVNDYNECSHRKLEMSEFQLKKQDVVTLFHCMVLMLILLVFLVALQMYKLSIPSKINFGNG